MKTILFMATSANGIIATPDGSEDFLSHHNWLEFVHLAKQTKVWIYGRKTYENVITWPKEYLDDLAEVKKIIVSESLKEAEGWTIAGSPTEALERLIKEGFEKVLLCGGSNLNSAFAKENLIDEIILNIDPIVVGQGIPLFKPANFDLKLSLVETKTLNNKTVQLHYNVLK